MYIDDVVIYQKAACNISSHSTNRMYLAVGNMPLHQPEVPDQKQQNRLYFR